LEYIIALVVISFVIYIYSRDREGWNATAKRLSTIVRANIEGSKPVKAIEPVKEHDDWTQQFNSIENPQKPALKHEIVRTWYAKAGTGGIRPHYQCKCGFKDWEMDTNTAQWTSAEHVRDQNAAEALLERNGGTRAW
jgi:hypothetical protein